jgi:hypothetical protein
MKLCVMKVVPTGNGTVTESRYGPWFVSVDAAVALATRIGGLVYERLPGTTRLKLRADLLDGGKHVNA